MYLVILIDVSIVINRTDNQVPVTVIDWLLDAQIDQWVINVIDKLIDWHWLIDWLDDCFSLFDCGMFGWSI